MELLLEEEEEEEESSPRRSSTSSRLLLQLDAIDNAACGWTRFMDKVAGPQAGQQGDRVDIRETGGKTDTRWTSGRQGGYNMQQ